MAKKPNIVFIFPDQWRGDCLSRYKHPLIETPYVDQLAKEGFSFQHAYTPVPSCVPSRACLATGMTPYECGRVGYLDGQPWPYQKTYMHLLKESGYQTMSVGKLHYHPQSLNLGFEINRSYEASVRDEDFTPEYHLWLERESGGKVKDIAFERNPNAWTIDEWTHEERLHNTNWIADTACDLVTLRDQSRPFLMQVGFHRPHPPFDPPVRFMDTFRDADTWGSPVGDWVSCDSLKDFVSAHNAGRCTVPGKRLDRVKRAYAASISHVDSQIGKIMMHLNSKGLLQNTWVVMSSDHGEMLGDHHFIHKAVPYEGSSRIPLVVRPPNSFKGQKDVDIATAVTISDLMPTF